MHITINEVPRTKKNSMQIVKMGGHYTLIPSKQYREYEKACAKYFYDWVAEPITYPCEVKCTFYVPTRRKVDLCNLIEAAHDVLVKYGVLGDDNRDIVCSVDGSRVYYNKQHPRTEIEITQYEGEYEVWK